jgi:hypothetical protein
VNKILLSFLTIIHTGANSKKQRDWSGNVPVSPKARLAKCFRKQAIQNDGAPPSPTLSPHVLSTLLLDDTKITRFYLSFSSVPPLSSSFTASNYTANYLVMGKGFLDTGFFRNSGQAAL